MYLFISIYINVYIYIYICVYVCVCEYISGFARSNLRVNPLVILLSLISL